MAFSMRLDPETERALTRLARRRRQTKSAVVREAIAAFERGDNASTSAPRTPFDALSPFIGVVKSGDSHRSENTGEAFYRLLKEKARGRRPR